MMHGWYGWPRFGFGFMGCGFMMIFWVLLIGLAVYFIVKSTNRNNHHTNGDNRRALDILDEKYAAGEIDEEEYLRKKNLLKK